MGNKELRHAFEINYEVTIGVLKDKIRLSEYTDAQIAEHMGYTPKTINNWLNGKTLPGFDKLDYMCRILNCSTKNIVVRNYQVEYPTLTEQTKYFKEHLRRALSSDRCDEYDECDITVLFNVIEEIECPAYNSNEMMQYMQLMDEEAIQYLIGRLINIGNTDRDTEYIRKQFKFVIEHMIPETEEKKDLADDIDYCTHRPFFLDVTDESSPLTLKVFDNYRDNYLRPYFDKRIEAVRASLM